MQTESPSLLCGLQSCPGQYQGKYIKNIIFSVVFLSIFWKNVFIFLSLLLLNMGCSNSSDVSKSKKLSEKFGTLLDFDFCQLQGQ